MKRSMILERLYELKGNKLVDEDSVDKLMKEVLSNKISEKDAESELKLIDPTYVRYNFLSNLKGKPLYKNIIEYKKGNLNTIQILKMLSSLVTQIFIQVEHNPDMDPKSLQINDVLHLIEDLSSDPENINTSEIDRLLSSYGWEDDT